MYDETWLNNEMRTINYDRIDQLAYRATWSTPEVEHLITFSVDSNGYFDGGYGLRNAFAEEFGLESVIKHSLLSRQWLRDIKRPKAACSMSFAFGAIDNFTQSEWKRVPAHKVFRPEIAGRIAPFVRDRVLPIIRSIVDLEALLGFLIADKPPTIWFVTNPAIRAAQIVAVGSALGRERREILAYLKPFERPIAIDLIGRPAAPHISFAGSLEPYVDHLIADLQSIRKS